MAQDSESAQSGVCRLDFWFGFCFSLSFCALEQNARLHFPEPVSPGARVCSLFSALLRELDGLTESTVMGEVSNLLDVHCHWAAGHESSGTDRSQMAGFLPWKRGHRCSLKARKSPKLRNLAFFHPWGTTLIGGARLTGGFCGFCLAHLLHE